ncbi:MAG: prolipoprotein diacylglyceryl transferase [Rhodobacteraceae bacterium]|nr:prolipoprotein diacylglyceryl transferase [Paracoccaceae bacterium]
MPLVIHFPEIDPAIVSFELFGLTLAIRWYALAYVVGFGLAWLWAMYLVRNSRIWRAGQPPLMPSHVEKLMTWLILGTILGGRLGFVLFYNPAHYLRNPLQVVQIWEGGMSFHGGAIGVGIAGLLFCWRHRLPVAGVADIVACSVPPGLGLGRVANFVNAELWGRPTDVSWAVVFPGRQASECPPWWAHDVCSRHPSQLYEALLEGAILFAVLAVLALRFSWLKRPGQLTGVFLIGYGLARFFVEFVRASDIQFMTPGNPFGHVLRFGAGSDAAGLTMGQTLSLPMIAAGLAVIVLARRASRNA